MAVTISNLLNIFVLPTETFEELKQRPQWIVTFVIIVLISIISVFLLLPFTQKLMFSQLAMQIGEEKAQQAFAVSQRFQYVGLLFIPIPLLVKWFFITVALYYSAILFDAENINFRSVFSIVVHVELILLFMNAVNILILQIKGIESVNNLTDLQAIIGLDVLLSNKSENIPLFTFLSNVNVFTVWYVIVLTIGVSVVSQVERWKSAIIVTVVWLFGVGMQVAFSTFSVSATQMMGR